MLAALAAPAPTWAQAAPADLGAEIEPKGPPQSAEDEAAQRRDRLDALFTRLAAADERGWEPVQAEIWALWTQSGSASMDLLLQRAAKAIEAGDLDAALGFANDLVRLDPDFAEGWNQRATIHFMRGELGRSVADIQRTLALEPRHFGAIFGLGMILERTGDKKGAMLAYRRGLELHPNLPGAREAVDRLAPDVDGREL